MDDQTRVIKGQRVALFLLVSLISILMGIGVYDKLVAEDVMLNTQDITYLKQNSSEVKSQMLLLVHSTQQIQISIARIETKLTTD